MNTKPRNITIVQAYSPTTAGLKDDINDSYQSLNATISKMQGSETRVDTQKTRRVFYLKKPAKIPPQI